MSFNVKRTDADTKSVSIRVRFFVMRASEVDYTGEDVIGVTTSVEPYSLFDGPAVEHSWQDFLRDALFALDAPDESVATITITVKQSEIEAMKIHYIVRGEGIKCGNVHHGDSGSSNKASVTCDACQELMNKKGANDGSKSKQQS